MVRETTLASLSGASKERIEKVGFFKDKTINSAIGAIASLRVNPGESIDELEVGCLEVVHGILVRMQHILSWLDSCPDFDLSIKRNLHQVCLLLPSSSECGNLLRIYVLLSKQRDETDGLYSFLKKLSETLEIDDAM